MKKILLIIISIFLCTSCERRIKDYAKYVSPAFLDAEQSIFAPLGVLNPGIISTEDSTFAGINFYARPQSNLPHIQPENFAGQNYAYFISPGYFRIETKNGEKCELATGQQDCLLRMVTQNKILVRLPHLYSQSADKISGNLNGHVYQLFLKNCDFVKQDSLGIITPSHLPALLFFSLKENAKPNWNFEHYYLNSLQHWNRAFNAIQYKAKDKKEFTPFYTAMYKALTSSSLPNPQSNYAELLFEQIQTDANARAVFSQLGISRNSDEITFTLPSCQSAIIAFEKPVEIQNHAKTKVCKILWNDNEIASLTPEQVLQGGTLIFE